MLYCIFFHSSYNKKNIWSFLLFLIFFQKLSVFCRHSMFIYLKNLWCAFYGFLLFISSRINSKMVRLHPSLLFFFLKSTLLSIPEKEVSTIHRPHTILDRYCFSSPSTTFRRSSTIQKCVKANKLNQERITWQNRFKFFCASNDINISRFIKLGNFYIV